MGHFCPVQAIFQLSMIPLMGLPGLLLPFVILFFFKYPEHPVHMVCPVWFIYIYLSHDLSKFPRIYLFYNVSNYNKLFHIHFISAATIQDSFLAARNRKVNMGYANILHHSHQDIMTVSFYLKMFLYNACNFDKIILLVITVYCIFVGDHIF